jgi:succinate dehydrogenase hydrophobic anchor subunit
MNNALKQPNLILGLISFFTLIFSVGLRANRLNSAGDVFFILTLVIGFVHWVWAIIDVLREYRSNKEKEDRNIIWVIFVIIVPPIGGIMYYAFNRNLNL